MPLPSTAKRARLVPLICLLVSVISCQRFFIPVSENTGSPDWKQQSIIKGNILHKYFVLRQGEKSYEFSQLKVDDQNRQLSGQLGMIPPEHSAYVNALGTRYTFKKNQHQDSVLNEVHIFVSDDVELKSPGGVMFSLDKITKIEVIEFDPSRTNRSYVFGSIGVGLSVIAAASIVILLTKSSCPFVSAYDGHSYQVQGELFGGAIYPSLERRDFLPLRIKPQAGEFKIMISNELQERQYTNYVRLMVIEHDSGRRALVDPDGHIRLTGTPQTPLLAVLNGKTDYSGALKATDNNYCSFDDTLKPSNLNTLSLTFARPPGARDGKLLLDLKNSYWFDFLYGRFCSQFGSRYNSWVCEQEKVPADRQARWSASQHIPLGISVRTAKGFRLIRQLQTLGPLTTREILIPVPLDDIPGDRVEIKLTTGFMFWELDRVAMDFSPDGPYSVSVLEPAKAVDESGKDVLDSLRSDDHSYLSQLQPGKQAYISFTYDRQPARGKEISVVLDTKGYYEPVREYRGNPNLAFLKQFKKAGAFPAFSRLSYLDVKNSQSGFALH